MHSGPRRNCIDDIAILANFDVDPESKLRPLIWPRAYRDVAAKLATEHFTNIQAKAIAIWIYFFSVLKLTERLEKLTLVLLRYTRAIIRHGYYQLDVLPFVP